MARGIVYVGGGGHHLVEQSAALVADRIARSLQDKLKDEQPFSYRLRLESDAYSLAPDIGLDIATIEVAKDGAWQPVLEILEVNYLDRFARRFSRLPAPARALKALWLLLRGAIQIGRTRWAAGAVKADRRTGALQRLDRVQAGLLNLVVMASIGSVLYWLAVAAVAVFGVPAVFGDGYSDLLDVLRSAGTAETDAAGTAETDAAGTSKADGVWVMIAIAVLLLLATALQKTFLDSLDRFAVESFAGMEYQLDDRHFLAVPNAIQDAIALAASRGYEKVDLLSFSLGAVLVADTIFPRKARKRVGQGHEARQRVWSPRLTIDNWITLGFPFDLIRWSTPDYFADRTAAVVDVGRWINVVIQDDFLGTNFKEGGERGIQVDRADQARAPDKNIGPLDPKSRVQPRRWDWIVPLRRAVNHRIYWDDEDARAPTCFADLIESGAAGWKDEVREALQKP